LVKGEPYVGRVCGVNPRELARFSEDKRNAGIDVLRRSGLLYAVSK
jgi:hypothetical protein